MVKDHSDSERGNPLPPHGLLFPNNSKCYFICIIPQTGSTYHGFCYTSRGVLVGTRNTHRLVSMVQLYCTGFVSRYRVESISESLSVADLEKKEGGWIGKE